MMNEIQHQIEIKRGWVRKFNTAVKSPCGPTLGKFARKLEIMNSRKN